MRFEVLSVVTIFWNMTPWNLADFYQCFGGIYCYHHHGQILSEVNNKIQTSITFYPEDVNSMFLRNVGRYLPHFTASQREEYSYVLTKCPEQM
jgi:hypothetical protein